MADEITTTAPGTTPGTVPPVTPPATPTATPAPEESTFAQKLAALLGINKADPAKAGDATPPAAPKSEHTFTQADIDAKLTEERQKWEADQAKEAELAKLSPEDRAKAEADSKDQKLAAIEAKLLQRDLHDAAVKDLDKGGYPVGLADLLDYSSKEQAEATLSKLKEVFTASLGSAINEKLRGKTPEGLGGAGTAENAIKDQIAGAVRGAV